MPHTHTHKEDTTHKLTHYCPAVPSTLPPSGTFLRGVLDKLGVEPQVKRIGEYKSAGDQLLRRDMSDAQQEQLSELLDDIHDHWVDTVAAARGKTKEVGGCGVVDGCNFANCCHVCAFHVEVRRFSRGSTAMSSCRLACP